MQHDISHCNNKECDIKDNCLRYQAHLEAIKEELYYVGYSVCSNKELFLKFKT